MDHYAFGRDFSFPDNEEQPSGGLRAIGTADAPIIFRGNTPDTTWSGIVIYHSSETVHLEYVTIRDAFKNDTDPNSRIWRRGGGLNSYVNDLGTIIRHCSFINNRASSIAGALAINGHSYWPNAGPVEITNSIFDGNTCECVSYADGPSDLCGGGAIRFSHIGGDAELVKLENNTFRNNQALQTSTDEAWGGAFAGFDSGIILGSGNVFDGNFASTSDGAISCAGEDHFGSIFDDVDPSVQFTDNSPNIGCGLD